MADYTVDPGGTGDYTTLSAAVAAASAGDPITCISSDGSADTTPVTIDKALTIISGTSDRASKTGWDTSKYRLSVGANSAITISVPGVIIDGLQITNSANSGIYIAFAGAGDITIKNSYIDGSGFGAYYMRAGNSNLYVYNCIAVGYSSSYMTRDVGGGMYVYNSVGYSATAQGVRQRGTGALTVVNCAIFNSPDDYLQDSGTLTISYSASDDGDGTNAVSPSGSDWDNEFADTANGDFTLINTGNLYDAGIGPSSDANVPTTDIDGDTRSGTTCDIGADEYSAGGGGETSIPVIMHHYAMMRK